MSKEPSSPEDCLGGGGPALPHTAPKGTPHLHSPPLTAGAHHRGHVGPAQHLQPRAEPTSQQRAENSAGPGLRVPSAPNQGLPNLPVRPFPTRLPAHPACHSVRPPGSKGNLTLLTCQQTSDLLPFWKSALFLFSIQKSKPFPFRGVFCLYLRHLGSWTSNLLSAPLPRPLCCSLSHGAPGPGPPSRVWVWESWHQVPGGRNPSAPRAP